MTLLVASLAGCDWPTSRGDAGRSGFNPETSITPSNVRELNVRWSVPVTPGSRSPIEGTDTVFLESRAFNASTGQDRWATTLIDGGAIAGDLVYGSKALNASGNDFGEVRALDVRTGVRKWSAIVNGAGAVIVADGLVFHHGGGGAHGGPVSELSVFDAATGAPVWGVGFGDGAIGGPVVADGLVFMSADDYHVDSRQFLWAYDEQTGALRYHVLANRCGGTVVAANGKVYANGQTFDAKTGRFLWDWPVCPTPGKEVTVTPNTVLVPYLASPTEPRLVAFETSNGALRWAVPWTNTDGLENAPAATNGVLFGVEPNRGPAGSHLIALVVNLVGVWRVIMARGKAGRS